MKGSDGHTLESTILTRFKEIDVLTNKDEARGISIKRITVKTDETAEQVRQSISAVIKTDGVEVINEWYKENFWAF